MRLDNKTHWVFDMDGTLTINVHDFDAIRDELGLPQGKPILEQLAAMPEDESRVLTRRLREIEVELAHLAVAAEGAAMLLDELAGRRCSLGILTRNSTDNAARTLEVCGLDRYFDRAFVYGRDTCAPKPHPEGLHRMLDAWQASPGDAVMVGDYLFDIECGSRAGMTTVYVDTTGEARWIQHADLTVGSLAALLDYIRE